MNASIQDVARQAGVSIATVSRTFTLPDKVSPKTRERVISAARELDFTISRSASSLKSGKAGRIAFLTGGEMYSWYDSQLLAGLNSILHAAGYDISIYEVHNSAERSKFFSDMSITRNADAVLVVSFLIAPQEAERIKATGIPLIGVNVAPMKEFSTTINIDEASGMRMAVNHLTSLGHRDIAYLCQDADQEQFKWNGADRLHGFEEACQEAPVPVSSHVLYAPKDASRADCALSQLLCMNPCPTAICCMNDEYAIPLYFRLLQSGKTVPADISLVGFDDSQYAKEIGLTTVHQEPFAAGQSAGKAALRLISGKPATQNVETQRLYLALRSSTAAPRH